MAAPWSLDPQGLSAAHFAAVVQSADDAIVSTSVDGTITSWNPGAERIFGYRAEEVLAQSIDMLVPPARAAEEEALQARLRQGQRIKHYETIRQHKDGRPIQVSLTLSPIRDEQGNLLGISQIAQEISERHSFAETRALLAAIVDTSEDAIISKDLNSIITSWNAAAERLFGYSAAEAIGRPITILFPPERHDEEASIIARIRKGERVHHYSTERVRKDGQEINVSLAISPIKNGTGQIIGASKIVRDITQQLEQQRQLQSHSERLRALLEDRESLLESERAARSAAEQASRLKDEFLATLSHELRTPLNAILGWSQVLKLNSSPKDLHDGLEAIRRNARIQTQLIEDLLDMSRIMSGKVRLDVQLTDMVAVIEAAIDSIRLSAEAKQIQVRKLLDPLASPVSGDPTRLQQIVWNLLTNAIKFTPKGGTVEVLLERVNSHLEITVHDSGYGIDPAFLPVIFERFRQADSSTTRLHGGLGLGLSIVKSLIEMHGGTVRAKSPGKDQGSTFIVTLPVSAIRDDNVEVGPGSSHDAVDQIDCHAVSLDGIRVLCVDDEPDARTLLTRLLAQCKADVRSAASADEGLQVLREFQPHVLISDAGMPGKDGYQFIREVRQLPGPGKDVPAIALTAFARSEDRIRAMMAGYQIHIAKPIEPRELIATIANLVGRIGQDR